MNANSNRFWETHWWRHAAIVFTGSMIISLLFVTFVPRAFYADTGPDFRAFYGPVARNILAGRGIVQNDGQPAIRYPPGYPSLLVPLIATAKALGTTDSCTIRIFNFLGLAVGVVLLFFCAVGSWEIRHAYVVAALWATYPFNLFFLLYPSAEIPFEVLLFSAVLLFLHHFQRQRPSFIWFFVCGILVGCAMLIRPIALVLAPVLALGYWIAGPRLAYTRRLTVAMALTLGTLITILPWEMWVCCKTDRIVLLSSLGPSSLKDGLTFAAGNKTFRHGVYVPGDVRQLMTRLTSQYESIQTYGDVARAISRETKEHPLAVLKLYLIKVARSWYGTDSQRWELEIALVQCPYLLLTTFAGFCCWRSGGKPRRLVTLIAVIVLYFWFMNIMSTTIARFSVPSMALMFLLVPGVVTKQTRGISLSVTPVDPTG